MMNLIERGVFMSKVRNALYFLLFLSVFTLAACSGGSDASTAQKLQASVDDNLNSYKEQGKLNIDDAIVSNIPGTAY
jgi:hypothetical protein